MIRVKGCVRALVASTWIILFALGCPAVAEEHESGWNDRTIGDFASKTLARQRGFEILPLFKLPADVEAAVKSVTAEQLFSVTENQVVKFPDQILKAERLVFQERGILEMTAIDQPYIVIVAKVVEFDAPQSHSEMRRPPDAKSPDGATGSVGANGLSYDPDNEDGGGRRGRNGQPGGRGEDGGTETLPDVYLLFGRIETQGNVPEPGTIDLDVAFPGLSGGNGGYGGQGGNGGDGERGRKAVQYLGGCKRGPGWGGHGGSAGRGGQGGNSGAGGDGAVFFISGPVDVVELMTYFGYRNDGGAPGKGGGPGNTGGLVGRGGNAGKPDLPNCRPVDFRKGSQGQLPSLAHLGRGDDSTITGDKGKAFLGVVDVDALF